MCDGLLAKQHATWRQVAIMMCIARSVVPCLLGL